MARVIWAAALTLLIASTSTVGAQQGARASRWQADQFGPIVPTDTMWSIASYYGRQRGISVNEMMDRIVANNPRAFRDNRPDFMLTGFYLSIPGGEAVAATAQTEAAIEPVPSVAETSPTVAANDEVVQSVVVENEIAISVSELQALRTQLSESIDLIENLQGENGTLRARLEAVTQELDALKARADEEILASSEMASLAESLEQGEQTEEASLTQLSQTAATELPDGELLDKELPAQEQTQPEGATDNNSATNAPTVTDAAAAASTATTDATSAEPAASTSEAATDAQAVQQAKTSTANSQTPKRNPWLAWLMKPLHLAIAAGVAVLLLLMLAYALYVRRVNREWDNEAVEVDERELTEAASEASSEPTSQVEETASETMQVDDDVADAAAQASIAATQSEWHAQEDDGEPYAEVSDVDLDAYLREQQAREQHDEAADDDVAEQVASEAAVATIEADEQHHYDDLSREVDALLAIELTDETQTDETEVETDLSADGMAETAAEPKSESESESETETAADAPDAESAQDDGYLLEPEAMGSFGGLRLDDPADDSETANVLEGEPASAAATDADEDDYLSIESLMEEADEEASKEHDDLYNKGKISEALGGDEKLTGDFDLDGDAIEDNDASLANQLDLAQVYLDMGETEEARTLLDAIAQCGDDEAEREANRLLQQLDEQGGR
ncbi:FimV/HubP family polar landmark protein [Pseudidiomarina sediminum]|uniref:FimV/HubP family polar landmark protein n=1 Tax=Pseudidiomarina sediminum TaxID=431675 RepID=UPI001C9865BC|nr:FimV/HubP family polar landmark protein [Pseudidiomarina sediminum]MBY6063507.1 hypothetical protein [Pseudidiomarina sediminum]